MALNNKEEIKMRFVNQFKFKKPEALAMLDRFPIQECPVNEYPVSFNGGHRFTTPFYLKDADAFVAVEFADEKSYQEFRPDVFFEDCDPRKDMFHWQELNVMPLDNNLSRRVLVESIQFINNQILFLLNEYSIFFKDGEFERSDTNMIYDVLYNMEKAQFYLSDASLKAIADKWDLLIENESGNDIVGKFTPNPRYLNTVNSKLLSGKSLVKPETSKLIAEVFKKVSERDFFGSAIVAVICGLMNSGELD